MYKKSLRELSADLHNKKISSVELTGIFLDRIKSFDAKLNSFITITADLALEQAKLADKRLQDGNCTPITGIPIAHKDLFCTKGVKTSCGSKMLDSFISPYESTVTNKLKQAGTVMLGKTNMDEFAMGSSNEHSYYGSVHNPWNSQTVPGGSSGGSAAAVAALLTPAATGTDTGGSIRQPSSYCNLTGLKPTYGRISRFGMVAFASSLDQAGPIAHSVEDVAMLLNHMAGFDIQDSTSIQKPVLDYTITIADPIKGLVVGLPKECFDDNLDTGIAVKIDSAISDLEKLGVKVKEISLPHNKLATSAYYIISPAECSSNLARFDGIRYGHRCKKPVDLDDLYRRSRTEGFGDEVKRRIMIGTYALSSGYYDAYYLKAQKIRRLISDDFKRAFNNVDIILTPTTPTPAFPIGNNNHQAINGASKNAALDKKAISRHTINMYLNDIYTIPANLAGLPAISIPAGFSEELPLGMQLIGNYFSEAKLLNIAYQYQQITDWHQQTPEGFT